jgi:hypothetical protein
VNAVAFHDRLCFNREGGYAFSSAAARASGYYVSRRRGRGRGRGRTFHPRNTRDVTRYEPRGALLSIPPKILHEYCLTHLAGPSAPHPSTHHHAYTHPNAHPLDVLINDDDAQEAEPTMTLYGVTLPTHAPTSFHTHPPQVVLRQADATGTTPLCALPQILPRDR